MSSIVSVAPQEQEEEEEDCGFPQRTGVYAEKKLPPSSSTKEDDEQGDTQSERIMTTFSTTTTPAQEKQKYIQEQEKIQDEAGTATSSQVNNAFHQREVSDRRLYMKNKRLATQDIFAPSDLHVVSTLAAKADQYAMENVGTLHSTYISATPVRTLYQIICEAMFDTVPNSALMARFGKLETNLSLSTLDLTGLYLGGRKGMTAVVWLLKECVNVTTVDFRQQYMGIEAGKLFSHVVMKQHPSLRSINLCGNYIEGEHVRKMIAVLRDNPRIVEVKFDEVCQIPSGMMSKLSELLARNQQVMKHVRPCRAVLNPLPDVLLGALKKASIDVNVLHFEQQMKEWRDD